MKLSVIIVSWNVREDLVRCLESIGENSPSEQDEVIVVDNASSDGTAERIRRDFPAVTVIANEQNRGFAAANNQAIQKAQGQYILLLNPDTIVHSGSLDALISFMDKNPDAGACGPKLLNADGTIQPSARRFPTFRGALYRHTIFRNLRVFRGSYEKWLMKDFDHGRQRDVDQLMGAALMLRRSAINEVGALDERFFMYYEEVDLCYRLRASGRRIAFVPQATITHLAGRSAEQVPAARRAMMLASMLTFFRKHRGGLKTAAFNIVFKPAVILAEVCRMLAGGAAFFYALISGDVKRKDKSLAKIRNSAAFLANHTWRLVFKM